MIRDVTLLRDCELFSGLSEEELTPLAASCSDIVVGENAILFSEGHTASSLYVVISGKIALQKSVRVPHARHSRRTTVALCYPGEVVGWSALVEPYRYNLSALAWESCRLMTLDASMLKGTLDLYPDIGYKVMDALCRVIGRRLVQTTESLITERERYFAPKNS